MKPEDDEPTEEEMREAAALAAALEKHSDETARAGGGAPPDAFETASLLRHARAPMTVSPALEPVTAAQVAPALATRRSRGRRRTGFWITASLLAPAMAIAFLLVSTSERAAYRSSPPRPVPSTNLLAAQAEATRGGTSAGAALARLDQEMRAYRRKYHEDLRRGGGAR